MKLFKVSGYIIVRGVSANDAKYAFAQIMSHNDQLRVKGGEDGVDFENWGFGESVEITREEQARLDADATHDPYDKDGL